jgi:SAM-dependent methyltransferase
MARITEALGHTHSVVNVGAGAGSYEPRDRFVIAVEPSRVMAEQRPRERVPALRATAQALPLHDGGVDAAMSVLSVHHWDEGREAGVREMRRVARGPVVILTCDPEVSAAMWLSTEYLPEIAALDLRTFPTMAQLESWLGGTTRIDVVPVPRDCVDWSYMSFWAHPERVLDVAAREATSGFARMERGVVERAVAAITRDLADGSWDRRHGELRSLPAFDAGLRLVVSTP